MKIGFDAKRYYHNNTGLGNYSRTIVKGLQEMYPDNDYVLYDEKSFARTFRLGKKAAMDGCDLFHGLSNELPFDAKVPSVVTIHDVCWRTYPEMYHAIDRKIYDWKYGSSCRRADRVIAISESTKRDVMRYYGVAEEKISVIYQPVQEFYYTPLGDNKAEELLRDLNIDEDYILYVGSINARKNLLAAVRALKLIPEARRPLLIVVGNGREYKKRVEDYIASHDLQKWIRVETNIHNNLQLQALYKKAQAFVYPSFYEGFGLPVVEAALQTTPVVTTTVSSLPEAAGPDACLFDPNAPNAEQRLAEILDALCHDSAYNLSVAQCCQQYAQEHFTPASLTKQVMSLYESLV